MTEKKKKIEPDDSEQSARFLETASDINAEDAELLFESAIQKVVLPKSTKKKE